MPVVLFFDEIGVPNGEKNRKEIIQIACSFLMDRDYAEFNECDVITNYDDIVIGMHYVTIPVKRVYKPEYLH
jgi:hypothetical protein